MNQYSSTTIVVETAIVRVVRVEITAVNVTKGYHRF